jgi:Lipocalin-like domain
MSALDPATLLGRWNIVAWEQLYDDGRRQLPLGEHLEGFIRYLEDGDMICMVARADQKKFESGGQWNASAEERAGAYSAMLAYAGTWSIDGEVVTHAVNLSLFPNWKGGEQKRHVRLDGDTLFIEAFLEQGTPEARTARLTWQRAK